MNPGLNIKTPENALLNPFEITRLGELKPSNEGIENPALEEPSSLTIALPFKPTVGCRIDFNNIPLNNLTPSKLLAEKLVFSPTNIKGVTPHKTFRRSLSVISEEAVDIGNELDCYQLELENSINEAKLRKKGVRSLDRMPKPLTQVDESPVNHSSLSVNITNINISIETKTEEMATENNTSIPTPVISPEVKEPAIIPPQEGEDEDEKSEISLTNEIDFKAPAPFVRNYRKPITQKRQTKENSSKETTDQSNNENDTKHKVSNLIRKSFRKLLHHNQKPEPKPDKEEEYDLHSGNIFNTLRQSLRRKAKEEPMLDKPGDISIIDKSERKVFKAKIDAEVKNVNEFSFRRSFRKSSKDVRNQVLKNVFKKNVDAYDMRV